MTHESIECKIKTTILIKQCMSRLSHRTLENHKARKKLIAKRYSNILRYCERTRRSE